MRLLAILAVLLTACTHLSEQDLADRMDLDGDGTPRPEDCDDDDPSVTLFTWHLDADADGYGGETTEEACTPPAGFVAEGGDCDDADASVNPVADEACNGRDDDCDGELDEGLELQTWYLDVDGDGYGGTAISEEACGPPSNYVGNADDCDDADRDIHPDAVERCDPDDVDEDCDGLVDDADGEVDGETLVTVYQDEDGDGYGVEGITSAACDAGDGWALVAGDCDDSDAERNPDTWWYRDADEDGYGDPVYDVRACEDVVGYVRNDLDCDDSESSFSPDGQEVCDLDDIDEDCDGLVEDDDPSVIRQDAYYWDDDGDGYGDPDSEIWSCEQPAGWITWARDCDDTDPSISPDTPEDCELKGDEDCDGFEGCDDVDCSAYGWCSPFDLAGADAILHSTDSGDDIGSALANTGDLDSDGYDDILVSCVYYHVLGFTPNTRAAYLINGPVSGNVDLNSSATAELLSENAGDIAGYSLVGLGDQDGDGFGDVAVGAPQYGGSGGSYPGAAYVLNGPLSGSISLGTSDAFITDAYSAIQEFGHDIASAGDVDDDGFPDLLIGSDGATWLFSGPLSGSLSTAHATARLLGTNQPVLADGHDLDGDGLSDVVVGDFSRSEAYVLLGPVSGSTSLSGAADAVVPIPSWGSQRPRLCAGGDFDGDGHPDIAASFPLADDHDTNVGEVYLFHGPLSSMHLASAPDATLVGETASACAGNGLAIPGDLDHDGTDDIAIGAPWGGMSYVVLGPVSGTLLLSEADMSFSNTSASFNGYDLQPLGDVDSDGAPDLVFGSLGDGAYVLHGARF